MDELEYIRMRQERYLYRKEQRMLKRRRTTIACIMVLLISITGLGIYFIGGKVMSAEKSKDSSDASDVSAALADPLKMDKPADEPKNSVDEPAEIPEPEEPIKKAEEPEPEKEPEEKTKSDYASYYCYESDKQSRYESYHARKPHLSVDEVVWQVNAHLDQPFYGYDVPVADVNDPFVIVNKYYKVSKSQEPNSLVTADGYLMTQATATAYQNMKRDAASNGLKIAAASTYRSVSYQEGLYNSYLQKDPKDVVDTYSARAGYSEHHTGMAIDFIGSFGSLNDFENTPEYPWVRDNCHRYGFIIRYTTANQWITGYKNEPWHLRYVGTQVATDMKNKGVSSFEEYKVKYIDHTP